MGSMPERRLPQGLFPACADSSRDCCLKEGGIGSCTSLCELAQIRAPAGRRPRPSLCGFARARAPAGRRPCLRLILSSYGIAGALLSYTYV